MTLSSPQVDAWADFKREHGLDDQSATERDGMRGPTLTRVRREVARLGRGRPRKQPPVPVPADQKFCWGCQSVLPLSSFATDNKNHDRKRINCRSCDDAARRARLKAQVTA